MKHSFLVLLSVLLFTACATSQQRAEQQEQRAAKMAEAIAQRQLRIEITGMNTQRYGSKIVTPDFFLELCGDTLISYLPYLGQVRFSATYGSPSQGLNFTAPIEQLEESRNRRGMTRLEMLVKSDEDHYIYRVDVWPDGHAFIHVRSQYRDPISFDGTCNW